MHIRNIESRDYQPIISVLDEWWGGRSMRDMLPRLFFIHFRDTSFVATDHNGIAGFVIGFLSPTLSNEGYIHFVGVNPSVRGRGVGRALYEHFFDAMRSARRYIVRCSTAPFNTVSVAFHQRLGFQAQMFDTLLQGIPYSPDHDGPGEHRVLFAKDL